VISISGDSLSIDLKLFSKYPAEVFGEILKQSITLHLNFEFEFNDYEKIQSLINNRVGKSVYLSENLTAVREREKIVIYRKRKSFGYRLIEIKIGEEKKVKDKSLKMALTSNEKVKFDQNKLHEFISADNLDYKFIIRKWKDGDKFIPLGMKDFKNVSDFLTEQKLSFYDKKEQLLLINRNNIVWVIGLRIDDRYRLNKNTKKVCELWLK
jgi:tRNA(Ile)-lysidine synthase